MAENQEQVEYDEAYGDLDEEEQRELIKTQWNPQLLAACKSGDLAKLQEAISKKAEVHQFDKKKKKEWTPLVWAVCKGHTDVVRFLIDHQALEPYLRDQRRRQGEILQQDEEDESSDEEEKGEKVDLNVDTKGKPICGRIHETILPSPMQWACFKGHLQ